MENIEGYMNLATAVVEMVVRDYENALRLIEEYPLNENENAERMILGCERFFQRDLGSYTIGDIDGESIINAIRRRVQDSGRINGEYRNYKQLAVINGISVSTYQGRVWRGWKPYEAATLKPRAMKRRRQ